MKTFDFFVVEFGKVWEYLDLIWMEKKIEMFFFVRRCELIVTIESNVIEAVTWDVQWRFIVDGGWNDRTCDCWCNYHRCWVLGAEYAFECYSASFFYYMCWVYCSYLFYFQLPVLVFLSFTTLFCIELQISELCSSIARTVCSIVVMDMLIFVYFSVWSYRLYFRPFVFTYLVTFLYLLYDCELWLHFYTLLLLIILLFHGQSPFWLVTWFGLFLGLWTCGY